MIGDFMLSLTALRDWWDRLRCEVNAHAWVKAGSNRMRKCARCPKRQWLDFHEGWIDCER